MPSLLNIYTGLQYIYSIHSSTIGSVQLYFKINIMKIIDIIVDITVYAYFLCFYKLHVRAIHIEYLLVYNSLKDTFFIR